MECPLESPSGGWFAAAHVALEGLESPVEAVDDVHCHRETTRLGARREDDDIILQVVVPC